MIEAMMIVKNAEHDHWQGGGRRTFDALPRIGEMIGYNKDGSGHFFRVVMVSHPENPTGAVDIHVVEAGVQTDVLAALFRAGA